jgi:hypothetical protein
LLKSVLLTFAHFTFISQFFVWFLLQVLIFNLPTDLSVALLMALVHSVIKRLPNSCPWGTIHGRTCGCQWNLLKVRGNTNGSMVGPGGSWKPREGISALQVFLKPMDNPWEGENKAIPRQ